MAKHRGRDVLFDDVLGFYHGGVLRLQGGESDEGLDDAIEQGLLKLEQGGVAGVELVSGAPVEVHRQFDIETDDLVVTWRVACREVGATH